MIHSQTNEVRFTEVDSHSRLTPVALYNLFQEAAVCHGDAVALSGAELKARGYAWVLNRIRMDIAEHPRRRDPVTVTTWGSTLSGLYAIREWTATGVRGELYAAATSRWVLLDLVKKRVVKMPGFIAEGYGVHEGRAIEEPFDRVTPVEGGIVTRRFHVRASDLDVNQHANSACYVDWCLEGAPKELLLDGTVERLDLTYKRESRFGDELNVETREERVQQGPRIFHHVIRFDGDGAVAAFGRSAWRNES